MAERRIAEQTGRGVVCLISNYSYLSEPSFVVIRQRFSSEFDRIWIDNLNGDSRETGKRTPDGKPDPSVFSTEYNKAGMIDFYEDPEKHPLKTPSGKIEFYSQRLSQALPR